VKDEHLTPDETAQLLYKYRDFTFAGLVQLYESECALRDKIAQDRARVQQTLEDLRARLRQEHEDAEQAFKEHMK